MLSMLVTRFSTMTAMAAGLAATLLAGGLRAADAPRPAAPSPQQPHVAFVEGRPFAEVLRRARAEKKPVMLDVVAAWCGPCKIMDKTTFSDPDVVAWTKDKVVAARVDAEKGEGRKLGSRYAVRSFPTVIFMDANGKEIDRLLGAHPAADFKKYGSGILAGTSGLQNALENVKKKWTPEEAQQLAQVLAQRNDLPRMGPIARRLVQEDPDLTNPGTLDVFFNLIALEDYVEKVEAETADLISTYLPRLSSDPRYGVLAIVLSRELARRGDMAGARSTVSAALKVVGETSNFAADLLAAQALAEQNAGKPDAAAATYKRAIAAAANNQPLRASLQLDLADIQASSGKVQDARTNLQAALELGRGDVGALTRAARVSLKLKANQDAVSHAKSAVGLSLGEDAAAQAVLAAALAATGDEVGAAAAWKRASEIDPDNPEYQKRQREPKKKVASSKAS